MSCGTFAGEQLVDGSGNYVGDFRNVTTWDHGTETPFLGFGVAGEPSIWYGPAVWPDCFTNCDDFVSFFAGPSTAPRFSAVFGASSWDLSVVNDPTGPPGLEDMPAAVCKFGTDGDGMAFVGPGNPGSPSWTVPAGDGHLWVAQCWLRTWPDDDGFLATGQTVSFVGGQRVPSTPFSAATGYTLTDSWGLYRTAFTGPFSGITLGELWLGGGGYGGHRKGAFATKCWHLYPVGAKPNTVFSFSGRTGPNPS